MKKVNNKNKEFKSNAKPRNPNFIKEKSDIINNKMTLLKRREMVYNGFEIEIFQLPNHSIVLAEPEKLSSSEKSGSSEQSNYYYEHVSPLKQK